MDHIITEELSNDYKNKKLSPEERRVVSKAINSEAIKENKITAATHKLIPIFKKNKKQFNRRMETQTAIHNFYLENSVIDPGKKSFIKIKGEKFQKQYLSHSIIDLWDKFNLNRKKTVSYATFARHRPPQCVFPNVHGRDTCACLQHENMKYLTNYLHSKKIITESSDYQLSKAVTCEKANLDCLSRKCVVCKDQKINLNLTGSSDQTHSFKILQSIKEKRTNEKTGREIVVTIAKKVELKLSTAELKDHFHQEFENFLSHLHKIFHQAKAYKELKSSLKDNEAVIIVDFSQNYQCKYSVETQGVHFGASRTQITLHTGVLYTKNAVQGFASLSENLRHDSCAVTAHLEETIKQLISKGCLDNIDTLHFMSDGPTAQYKNKNMFYLTTQYLVQKFPRFQKLTYNYSESGHGKNAADGIGASIKRTADDLIKYGTDIPDYKTFLENVKEKNQNIIISSVTKEEIVQINKKLPELKAITGTRKIYQFRWNRLKPNVVNFNFLSCFKCDASKICTHHAKSTYSYPSAAKKLKNIDIKFDKITVVNEKVSFNSNKRKSTTVGKESQKDLKKNKSEPVQEIAPKNQGGKIVKESRFLKKDSKQNNFKKLKTEHIKQIGPEKLCSKDGGKSTMVSKMPRKNVKIENPEEFAHQNVVSKRGRILKQKIQLVQEDSD